MIDTDELKKIVITIGGDDNARFHPEGYVKKLEAIFEKALEDALWHERIGSE
jgi:hypothetical protein